MANSQTADWRLRETINKRIERQIREGYQPLTRYKTLFPFTEGGDIIDRRTGKVKNVNTFVAEYVNKQIGTPAAFVAKMGKYGVPKTTAKQAYAAHKAERLADAKAAYSKRLHVLAGMDITRTGSVRMHYRAQTDAIFQLYLSRCSVLPFFRLLLLFGFVYIQGAASCGTAPCKNFLVCMREADKPGKKLRYTERRRRNRTKEKEDWKWISLHSKKRSR